MKFHIVQMGETIEEIIFLYNLTRQELTEENRHIKKWDKLIPGTKLKIPVITEAIDEEVMEIVKNNEPNNALYADNDGLYFYEKILENYRNNLMMLFHQIKNK